MDTSKLQRNIKLYYFFETFSEPLFWAAVLILYLKQVSGMDLPAIYRMESICLIVFVFWEIPSGALADAFGRKRTILIGRLILFAHSIIYAFAGSATSVWASNLLWAAGQPLVSGADSALLYDSLKALGRENEFKKITGRAKSYRLLVMAFGALATGFLTTIDLRLGPLISIIFLIPNLVASFLFVEPPHFERSQSEEPTLEASLSFKQYWRLIGESLLFAKNNLAIRWLIIYSVILAVTSKLWFFTYNDYFALAGLPLSWFGIIFFALNIVSAIFSYSANWLERHLGEWGSFILMPLCLCLPLLVMGFWVALPCVWLVLFQNVVRGYQDPFLDHFYHRHIDSKRRATIYSIRSATVALAGVISLFVFGYLLKVVSLPTALIILGLTVALSSSLLLINYKNVFKPNQN
jgi:MFS family permease